MKSSSNFAFLCLALAAFLAPASARLGAVRKLSSTVLDTFTCYSFTESTAVIQTCINYNTYVTMGCTGDAPPSSCNDYAAIIGCGMVDPEHGECAQNTNPPMTNNIPPGETETFAFECHSGQTPSGVSAPTSDHVSCSTEFSGKQLIMSCTNNSPDKQEEVTLDNFSCPV